MDDNKELVKASFELNNETLEACTALDGDAIGATKKIDFKDCTKRIKKIQKEYAGYQIQEVISFTQAQDGEEKFYVFTDERR